MEFRNTAAVRTRRRPQAIPIYLAGGAWALYACLFPLYRAWHFLAAAAVAALVWLAARHFFPDAVETVAVSPDTGDRDADGMILLGREMLAELRALDAAIADAAISAQTVRMAAAGERILAWVGEEPSGAPRIRRFLQYFLPTALKLLRAYVRLDAQGIEGEHITSGKDGIRAAMGTVADAFERQLDTLLQGEVLDIAAEIDVLETMLAREGLADSDFDDKQEESR